MTKDEALTLALEALYENTQYSLRGDPVAYQDERNDDTIKIIKEVLEQPNPILAEREACAKVCESHGPTLANSAMLADAIRARGNT